MNELKPCRPRNFRDRNMRAWCGGYGVDTGWDGLGELYTVTDDVWEQAWPGVSLRKKNAARRLLEPDDPERKLCYFLCIGCLEQRLGRKLTSSDFVKGNVLNNVSDVYRDRLQPLAIRMRAAKEALPFESPKLSVIASIDDRDGTFAQRLDRAIERSGQTLKLIEHQPAPEARPMRRPRRER